MIYLRVGQSYQTMPKPWKNQLPLAIAVYPAIILIVQFIPACLPLNYISELLAYHALETIYHSI